MGTTANPRSAAYADQFDAAQAGFIELIESLDDDRWQRVGTNYPQRMNDEDEGRTVAVIAHHVAASEETIIDRIQVMLRGENPPPFDARTSNARHAKEHSGVSRDEVLKKLRHNKTAVVEKLRAIPDHKLDITVETPVGPLSVSQRIERVLIGHIAMHRGSIEGAIS